MSGNRSASTLLTRVKDLLNNQTICTNAELYRHMDSVYKKWFEWLQNRHPDVLKTTKTITYTASAFEYDLSGSFSDAIYRIESVRDYTDGDPGIPLDQADSHESIIQMQFAGVVNTTVYGNPTHWYYFRDFSVASGVYTVVQKLLVAPVPTGARSLKMVCQLDPLDLTVATTYTTGLPHFVEELIIIETAILARLQEGDDKSVALFKERLGSAEVHAISQLKPIRRGPTRIRFDPRIID